MDSSRHAPRIHLNLRGRARAVLHVDLDLLAALASLVGHLDGVLAGLVPRGLLDGVGDLLVLNIDLDFLHGDGLSSPQQLGVDLRDPCAGHWEKELGVRLMDGRMKYGRKLRAMGIHINVLE